MRRDMVTFILLGISAGISLTILLTSWAEIRDLTA